jgi:hypothetical protein
VTAQQTSVTREIDWKLICNTVVSHVVFVYLIPLLNLSFCGPEIIGQLTVLQGISGSLLKASYFRSQLVQFLDAFVICSPIFSYPQIPHRPPLFQLAQLLPVLANKYREC